jgi:hypothetical protein
MPDANSTAQVLQNIAAAQQARIRDMTAAKVQGARNFGDGITALLGSYDQAQRTKTEEQAAADRSALSGAQLQGVQNSNQAFQANEDAKDEIDPNSEEGLSYREEGPALGADAARQQIAASQASTEATQAGIENQKLQIQDSQTRTAASIKQAADAHELAVSQNLDEHQRGLVSQYRMEREGLAQLPPGPQRDQQVQALNQLYQTQGLPQSAVSAMDLGSQASGDQLKASAGLAKESLFNISPDGQRLHGAVSDAQNDANYYQSLVTAQQKYSAALKVPGFDEAGSINEKSPAADARQEFANLLATHGHQKEASDLLSPQTPWNTALDQMNGSIQSGLPGAIQQWNNIGKASVPSKYTSPTLGGQPNPDYKGTVDTVDHQFANIQKQYNGGGQQQGPTPGVDTINPLTGQPNQARNLRDAIAAKKAASGAQGAVGAPGPVAQPAPPPQSGMPQGAPQQAAPGPQVVLPDVDPMLGGQ